MPSTEKNSSLYALVLAGGSGRRFWPVSRDSHPKQLLNLFGGRTMIEESVARLEGLVPPENILVLTNPVQEEGVRKVLDGQLPPENIVAEPERRDTAPAIALAVAWVAARDEDATMMVLPADHLIKNEESFREVMGRAADVAGSTEALVTLGIKPTWACPGYGYIERAGEAELPDLPTGSPVYEVAQFREKPNSATAQDYIDQGNYSWNAGIFVWSIKTVRKEFSEHCPELADFVSSVVQSDTPSEAAMAGFGSLPKISIDFALMENASRVLNIEATFDWDDLGSWISVAEYLKSDGDSNNRSNTGLSQIDSKENIVFCDDNTHVGLLGVEDLVIIRTGDSLLIAKKDQADGIKALTDALPPELLK